MPEINTLDNDIQALKKKLVANKYSNSDVQDIMEAVWFGKKIHGEQKRASGEPFFIHPLTVAGILVDLNLDKNAIIASLLHDTVEDTEVESPLIESKFGSEVSQLVEGVTKISIVKAKNKSVQEIETLRKMLLAMVKDIRVILIKLADKLHNMRTLSYLSEEKQQTIAEECLEIYAPLAGQLGISWIKAELEDLALKYINPDVYEQIKQFLAFKRKKRAEYLKSVEKKIKIACNEEGIEIDISTRAKHFYSIYKKMSKTGKELGEIYDLLGIRVLCTSVNECYTILGLVHKLWIPIERRFKDYIAVPKSNRYQSLHTTVMTDNGKILEVQIRTYEMHRIAEYGIASHWLYKVGKPTDSLNPKDISLVNKLMNWNNLETGKTDFLNDLKKEILKDTIYVFTPAGDVFEMPTGATAIDFAYHIHTEVGNHCSGAKADGYIIPLHKELKNTQVVEIITNNTARPNLQWLRMAKTNRARTKIRQWLNKNDDSLIIKKNIVVKNKKTEHSEDDKTNKEQKPQPESGEKTDREVIKEVMDRNRISFTVGGEKNMMISFAKCCSPIPGDPIIGYISVGRGIIVHKNDCQNVQHIKNFSTRSIEVEWEAVSPKSTRKFKVTSKITYDLFSEIESAIKKHRGHLIEGRLFEDDNDRLSGFFTIEIDKKDDFGKVVKSIRTIPSIINIYAV
ncbi:MAG: bifunctional (p)ppGpp synthetase/guanosine-3',5'-bis(diphosphate) 3'-pyrophosphohydrolase [Spirochaetia bacterium]|jgi:GTP pyrophosphokinase|nr:bifunctional (p)ppGpp synthetase/guanosine-3',5'-bis(diphosphate) 3'-pyrophosphohydrolase [Spirochaetia bacterium]